MRIAADTTAVRKGDSLALRDCDLTCSLDSRNGSGDLKELFHYADHSWRTENGVQEQVLPPALLESRAQLDTFVDYINELGRKILEGLAVGLKVSLPI